MGRWIKIVAIIMLTIVSHCAHAQFEMPEYGTRSSGMGGCAAALKDFGSGIENIAALALLNCNQIALSTNVNHSLAALSTKNIAASVSTHKGGALLIKYQHFGQSQYNEQKTTIGYALTTGKMMNIGIALHYLHSGCEDSYYQRQNLITFSAGMQYYASESLTFGLKIFNPAMIRLQCADEIRIGTVMQAGIAYSISSNLMSSLEIEKQTYWKPSIKAGLEYALIESFMIRAGIASNPVRYSFGVGVERPHLHLGLSLQTHPTLGASPHLGIGYRF